MKGSGGTKRKKGREKEEEEEQLKPFLSSSLSHSFFLSLSLLSQEELPASGRDRSRRDRSSRRSRSSSSSSLAGPFLLAGVPRHAAEDLRVLGVAAVDALSLRREADRRARLADRQRPLRRDAGLGRLPDVARLARAGESTALLSVLDVHRGSGVGLSRVGLGADGALGRLGLPQRHSGGDGRVHERAVVVGALAVAGHDLRLEDEGPHGLELLGAVAASFRDHVLDRLAGHRRDADRHREVALRPVAVDRLAGPDPLVVGGVVRGVPRA